MKKCMKTRLHLVRNSNKEWKFHFTQKKFLKAFISLPTGQYRQKVAQISGAINKLFTCIVDLSILNVLCSTGCQQGAEGLN